MESQTKTSLGSEKTLSKREALNKLFKENGLLAEDVHQHKHYTIIARTGIEKIQYKNNVRVFFKMIRCEKDFVVVKAVARKDKDNNFIEIETYGSASGETSQNKYYAEMAEKRALSRAVLKITDFYQYGVYGEDEADEFKKVVDLSPIDIKPPVVPDPVVSENPNRPIPIDPGNDPHQTPELRQLRAKLLLLLNDELITEEEKNKMVAIINKLTETGLREKITKVEAAIRDRSQASKATKKQLELLDKLFLSHVITPKERLDYHNERESLNMFKASNLIEHWTKEIKVRKEVESEVSNG